MKGAKRVIYSPTSLKLFFRNYWGIVLSLASALLWVIPKFEQPYVIDEAAFPYAASAVANTGKPVYYNGELALHNIATWHPPLYVYSLGAFMHFFGDSQIATRSYSLICFLITSFLIYKTILKLNPHYQFAANAGLVFYSLNYFVLASTLIPDIDGTLLPLVIALFLYIFSIGYVSENQYSKLFNFWEILTLGLCFSTKMTTTLLFPALIFFVTYARCRKALYSMLRTAISFFSAVVLFLAWWIPVAHSSNLEWQEPFNFTLQSLTHKSNHPSILDFLKSMFTFSQPVISWLGPLGLVVFAATSWRAFKAENKEIRIYSISILGVAITVALLYNAITAPPFTFPKYWNISFIFLAVALGTLWPKTHIKINFKNLIPVAFFAVTAWSLDFLEVNDRLKKSKSMTSFGIPSLTLCLVIFLAGCSIFILQQKYKKLKIKYFIFPLMVSISLLHSTAVSSAIENQKFSTRYFFGESGESEVIDWIRLNIKSGDKIMAAKDIGLQSHQVFYEDAVVFASHSALTINRYLKNENIEWIVVRNLYDWSPAVYPEIFSALARDYSPVKGGHIGDFQIWRLN
jgi:Dolichyl-phosphate-mannose-protein mannosyltransferase